MKRTIVALNAGMLLFSLSWAPALSAPAGRTVAPPATLITQHRYFGSLAAVNGTMLLLRLRNGRLLRVDAGEAFALKRVAEPLFAGKPTVVEGTLGASGVLRATAVRRAAPNAIAWGADR